MGNNLLTNGDFTALDSGFSSDYSEISPDGGIQTTVDEYAIISNPSVSFTNGYLSYGDHTTGSGQMLFVDGTGGTNFWDETVTLAANTSYAFSYFVTGADSSNLPVIQLTVNGQAVDSGVAVTQAGGGANWQQVTETFTTGAGGSTTVALSDLNNSAQGNDFTVDDLSLSVYQNLLVNGDFSAGTTGFSSDYTQIDSDRVLHTDVDEYAVVLNPAVSFSNGYSSYGDHTTGSGDMLFVDGTGTGAFWKESVSLAANTSYTFSYYVTGADNTNLPVIQLSVDGVAADAGVSVTQSGGGANWQQVTETFTTGAVGPNTTVALSDLNAVAEGNDFTVDDLSLAANAACYARGTRIAAPDGEHPIETLAIGQLVMTASGIARPIKWIGRRCYSGRFLARNPDLWPVCFRAGALADGVPRRDLYVSPRHAMVIDGLLIPAIDLVNGVTIAHTPAIDEVAYYHVELDTHDILLADGAASESFVDDDSRGLFHNAREFDALYPGAKRVPAFYCAPRVDADRFRHELRMIRQRLDTRAGTGAMPPRSPLRGFVDLMDHDLIEGWAQNSDLPEVPVCLDILVDGALITRTLANRFRDDLAAIGYGSGQHGFSVKVPGISAPSRRRSIEVRRSSDQLVLPPSFSCNALNQSAIRGEGAGFRERA